MGIYLKSRVKSKSYKKKKEKIMTKTRERYKEMERRRKHCLKYIIDHDLSQIEIERLTKKAYFSFYFRPLYIVKAILRVKSLAELLKYMRVGFRMLFLNRERFFH